MKKTLYFAVIILLFAGCNAQKKLVSVNRDTNEITLKKGQSCEIEFVTNASTGYWWQLLNESDVNIVKSGDSRYESNAPKGMIGASSRRYWTFEAVQAGTQTLHFVYARSKVDEATRTRDVTITVK